MTHVRCFQVSKNQLSSLPREIGMLRSLCDFDVSCLCVALAAAPHLSFEGFGERSRNFASRTRRPAGASGSLGLFEFVDAVM